MLGSILISTTNYSNVDRNVKCNTHTHTQHTQVNGHHSVTYSNSVSSHAHQKFILL